MVSAQVWKLEPSVARRVSRQRDKWFQHVFKSSEPWGSLCCHFANIQTQPIPDCSGSVWGWQVGAGVQSGEDCEVSAGRKQLRGRQSQISSKNKHLAPYNTHSGWSNAGAQRELLIWKDLRARKIVEKSSPSERLPTQDWKQIALSLEVKSNQHIWVGRTLKCLTWGTRFQRIYTPLFSLQRSLH